MKVFGNNGDDWDEAEGRCNGDELRALVDAVIDYAEHQQQVHNAHSSITELCAQIVQRMDTDEFLAPLAVALSLRGYKEDEIPGNKGSARKGTGKTGKMYN